MEKFSRFARIAQTEFSQTVISTHDLGHKLRIYLVDKSFIDLFYTTKTKTRRFSIHWERSHIDKTFYRIDNMPDLQWQKTKSFPVHFHSKKYKEVKEPPFKANEKNLETTLRNFLKFAEDNV